MFPQDLKELRIHAGLSVSELAERADITKVGLYKIEARTARPRVVTAVRLAEALNLQDHQSWGLMLWLAGRS